LRIINVSNRFGYNFVFGGANAQGFGAFGGVGSDSRAFLIL